MSKYKTLFSEDETYNEDGLELANEASLALEPILEKWGQEYLLRDILQLVTEQVQYKCFFKLAIGRITQSKEKPDV